MDWSVLSYIAGAAATVILLLFSMIGVWVYRLPTYQLLMLGLYLHSISPDENDKKWNNPL